MRLFNLKFKWHFVNLVDIYTVNIKQLLSLIKFLKFQGIYDTFPLMNLRFHIQYSNIFDDFEMISFFIL